MSRVRSDKFTNRAATGPCTFTHGMHSTDTAGTGIGVSLGYGGIVAVGATISGNLSVGGTITYEDTTNVDSTGIVTARNGIKVGQPTGVGATFNPAGDLVVAGVATVGTGLSMPDNAKAYFGNSGDLQIYHDGSNSYIEDAGTGVLQLNTNYLQVKNAADDETILAASQNGAVSLYYDNTKRFETTSSGATITGAGICTSLAVGPGIVQEDFHNYGTALTGTYNHDVVTHGMVLDSTVAASASFVINLRGDGSTTFNSLMNVGQTTVLTVYSVSSNASYYLTDFQIDGSSITEKWNGGSAPSAGTGSGTDVYTFNIMKTASATFSVYANFSNFA